MLSTLRDYQDRDIAALFAALPCNGTEDEKLGSVDNAIVNPESGGLRYLVVDAGWLKSRKFVVPADQVYAYDDSDDELCVNLSKSEAESLRVFDEACLASEDAFNSYEQQYRSVWRPRSPTTERPSEHLLRLRNRIREFHTGARGRTAQRDTGSYAAATYTGTGAHPTGLYGVYSDRKDVEKTVQALRDQGFREQRYLSGFSQSQYDKRVCD